MISLSDAPAWLAIVVLSGCWLAIGLVTGWLGHHLPLAALQHDTWLTRPRSFERGGRLYDRALRIRSWKDRLPEAGAAFRNGYSKAHIRRRTDENLERFVVETRRAEYVHWANAISGSLFVVFQPTVIVAVMVPFGLAVHLPFVTIQRYNRARLERALARRGQRTAATGAAEPDST